MGHSSLIVASMNASSSVDSATASFRDESKDGDIFADYNVSNVDLYFRTANVLHYASIVILGLFVLQVIYFHRT